MRLRKQDARQIYQRHPWLLKPAAILAVLLFPALLVTKWIIDAIETGIFRDSVSELLEEIVAAWRGFEEEEEPPTRAC